MEIRAKLLPSGYKNFVASSMDPINDSQQQFERSNLMEPNVIIYTNTFCPVCAMVRSFLDDHGIPYSEVNVDLHPIEMLKLIGKTRRLTVPQTSVNGTFISGFDPVGILKLVYPT